MANIDSQLQNIAEIMQQMAQQNANFQAENRKALQEFQAENRRALQEFQAENRRAAQENSEFRKASILSQQSLENKLATLSEELTQFIVQSRQSNAKSERQTAEMILWRQDMHDSVLRMEAICGRIELKK
jgi:hypothetical protein